MVSGINSRPKRCAFLHKPVLVVVVQYIVESLTRAQHVLCCVQKTKGAFNFNCNINTASVRPRAMRKKEAVLEKRARHPMRYKWPYIEILLYIILID